MKKIMIIYILKKAKGVFKMKLFLAFDQVEFCFNFDKLTNSKPKF